MKNFVAWLKTLNPGEWIGAICFIISILLLAFINFYYLISGKKLLEIMLPFLWFTSYVGGSVFFIIWCIEQRKKYKSAKGVEEP